MTILRAQKPDGTYGDARMDSEGRLLVSDGLDGPQRLLNYPSVGTPQTFLCGGIGADHLFYKGAGNSGKVTTLWVTTPTALEPTSELRIYVDAGNIADLTDPPADKLAARIPLQTLLGLRWDTTVSNARDTAILGAAQLPLAAGFPSFELTLPIPYADGILIQIWKNGAPHLYAAGDFAWVGYEEGPLPDWQYSSWRLRSGVFDGTVLYDNTIPNDPASVATFLNAPDGPGMLVGIYAAMASLRVGPSWHYAENNWELSIDGGDRNWQTSGTEDLFAGTAYYFQLGGSELAKGYTWGLTYFSDPDAKWEAYKLFTKSPIVWSNGCIGTWRNQVTMAEGGDAEAHILAVYYGE